jgi:bifunctional non-homologous end joining protein LigD
VAAAREARERLEAMGLVAFIKTTGGKGLHVVVPIARKAEWPEVRDFAKAFATAMTRDAPDRFTANLSKARRKGRIFVDYLRNQRGATAIAPYAVRARDGAPVATPIEWDELDDRLDPKGFNLRTAPDRLAGRGDPWVEIGKIRQSLTAKAKRAVGLP